jgi:hypothetical protein
VELVGPEGVGHAVRVTGSGEVGASSELFDGLVDDAGLFPPERLPMDAAVRRHRADEAAGNSVLTQRFLCPASALGELRARLRLDERWRIGLIVDVGLDELATALSTVDADERLVLETIELRLPAVDDPRSAVERVTALASASTSGATVHVELSPAVAGWEDALDAVADAGLSAKVRCGGLEAAAFPSAEQLAAFVLAAVRRWVAFKATAGLHHAVRYRDPQTGFTHHGFLNLLLAICAAVDGADIDEVAEVLLVDDGVALAERARAVPPRTAARARSLFQAYGSCSTSEPVEDLTALGLLEVARS